MGDAVTPQRPGWCIHYTAPPRGLRNNEPHICSAGIDLKVFVGTKFDTRPCFLNDGESKPNAAHCDRLRRPTPEEIAAHKQRVADLFAKMEKVSEAVTPWRRLHKGKSYSETLECPVCHGRLHLSIAASNGHVHGRCDTGGCVSWME